MMLVFNLDLGDITESLHMATGDTYIPALQELLTRQETHGPYE